MNAGAAAGASHRRLSSSSSATTVGRAAVPGFDVGGGVGALAGRGRGVVARLQRLGQRDQRVDHGLVALLGLAELLGGAQDCVGVPGWRVRRQRGRALVTALALGAFVVLIYFITIAKMSAAG